MSKFISILDPSTHNDLREYSPQDKPQRRRPIKINIQNLIATQQPDPLAKQNTPSSASCNESGFKGKKFLHRDEVNVSAATTCPIDYEPFQPRKLPSERPFMRINYLQNDSTNPDSLRRKSELGITATTTTTTTTPPGTASKRLNAKHSTATKVSDFSISQQDVDASIPERKKSLNKSGTAQTSSAQNTAGSRRSSKPEMIPPPDGKQQKKHDTVTRGRRSDSCSSNNNNNNSSSNNNCNTTHKSDKSQKRARASSNSTESKASRSGMKAYNFTWDSRESLGPMNSQISRCLEEKIKKIFERKHEKAQVKQYQAAEKSMRQELYGLLSRQSREIKQRKKQNAITVADILQKHLQLHSDADQENHLLNIQRVDSLVRQSIVAQMEKKREQEEKALEVQDEKMRIVENLETLKLNIKEWNNKRSKSQESSLVAKRMAWGADQQRLFELEQKRKIAHEEKKKKKQEMSLSSAMSSTNPPIDLKAIFSGNTEVKSKPKSACITAEENQAKEKQQQQQQQQVQVPADYEAILKGRVEKIVAEQRKASLESKRKKADIQKKLSTIESHRKQGIEKCKRVPFKPSEDEIEQAFQ